MKEKNTATTSALRRILVTCANQAKEYGSCVAAKVPEAEKDMCLKEFLALKSCMQYTVYLKNLFLLNDPGKDLKFDHSSFLTVNLRSKQFLSYEAAVQVYSWRSVIMLSNASSSSVGLGGSGALSHVYIQHPPLHCNIPGSRGFFYDDANRLLISATFNQVFSWKTAPFNPDIVPSVDSIGEGPILSIRFSLDEKVIAVQRSHCEIQFFHREMEQIFSYRCKSESESILGFFWSDCPLCDFAIIKTSGLDSFAYDSTSKSLRLVENKKLNVSWYIYTHESRLVLLASGLQCKTFIGFQLSSAGIVRLPRFEMAMAKSDANSKPILSSEDVHIVTVYGRIYCLQVDRVAMLLHSYRFYRDAVIQQGSLPIYSSKLSVSVVDNVLLVHQIDAKVVILYDIFVDSRAPVSAPLPLLLRRFPKSDSDISSQPVNKGNESSETFTYNEDIVMYGDGWTFLVPDLIYDHTNKHLWKIHIDLEAISTSSSEMTSVLEFLQRRKSEANKSKQLCLAIARTLILECKPVPLVSRAIDVLVTSYSNSVKIGTYKGIKDEKASTSSIPSDTVPKPRMDVSSGRISGPEKTVKHESSSGNNEHLKRSPTYLASDSEDNARHIPSRSNTDEAEVSLSSGSLENMLCPNVSDDQGTQLLSPVISPDELYKFVFASLEEMMLQESSYIVAIVIEFLRSAGLEKIKVHPNFYVMTIQLLAYGQRYAELALFIMNKIIEPSKEVALQLLELGRQNFQTRKLGLDMLRQLSLHHDYILFLAQDGYYLEALRYSRKHKVNTVPPSLFLETAVASDDPQHLATILRFLTDVIPGFRDTSEYGTYSGILNQMSSSLIV